MDHVLELSMARHIPVRRSLARAFTASAEMVALARAPAAATAAASAAAAAAIIL